MCDRRIWRWCEHDPAFVLLRLIAVLDDSEYEFSSEECDRWGIVFYDRATNPICCCMAAPGCRGQSQQRRLSCPAWERTEDDYHRRAMETAMSSLSKVMQQLKKKGTEQTRKTFARHGAPDEMFGVKVADMKVIAKSIKGEQDLACELYETGNADAQYLAGMVADGGLMTKRQLQFWAKQASWHMVAETTVPGVATESPHARDLAIKWIDSKQPAIAACGWCTYAGLVAVTEDEDLDLQEIQDLLERVETQIDDAPDRVRYTMNGFVIAVGSYVQPLLRRAKQAAKRLGKVSVDMGDTACKVPLATEYIEKVENMKRVGRKRKTIKC